MPETQTGNAIKAIGAAGIASVLAFGGCAAIASEVNRYPAIESSDIYFNWGDSLIVLRQKKDELAILTLPLPRRPDDNSCMGTPLLTDNAHLLYICSGGDPYSGRDLRNAYIQDPYMRLMYKRENVPIQGEFPFEKPAGSIENTIDASEISTPTTMRILDRGYKSKSGNFAFGIVDGSLAALRLSEETFDGKYQIEGGSEFPSLEQHPRKIYDVSVLDEARDWALISSFFWRPGETEPGSELFHWSSINKDVINLAFDYGIPNSKLILQSTLSRYGVLQQNTETESIIHLFDMKTRQIEKNAYSFPLGNDYGNKVGITDRGEILIQHENPETMACDFLLKPWDQEPFTFSLPLTPNTTGCSNINNSWRTGIYDIASPD